VKFFYRIVTMVSLVLILFSICRAEEIITGHYCYTYGDNESLKEARETTRMLAIRNAIESYRTFITSASTVKNFELTNDLIQIISSGYLKDLRRIDYKEEGRTICETIQATVSPQAIENIIRHEIRKRSKEAEETGIDSNEYLKIISVKTGEGKDGGMYITALIKVLKYCNQNYPCYIYVTFFDLEGNPIDGDRRAIYDIHQGEIRSVYIGAIPPNARSYKVWLRERTEK